MIKDVECQAETTVFRKYVDILKPFTRGGIQEFGKSKEGNNGTRNSDLSCNSENPKGFTTLGSGLFPYQVVHGAGGHKGGLRFARFSFWFCPSWIVFEGRGVSGLL